LHVNAVVKLLNSEQIICQ